MLGYYGETIGPRSAEVVQLAAAQAKKQVIHTRPADLLKPEWDELRSAAIALNGCNGTDEDVLTYAMFPQVAPKFFATRHEGPKNVGKDPAARAAAAPGAKAGAGDAGVGPVRTPITYDVKFGGKTHKVTVAPAQ
jgi:methylmalonyl-CoA carboxyltransferase 5S subunit